MSSDTRTPAATILIDSAHDLTIFKQMLDKHQKGTEATKNTVESFGGDPHAMDDVLYAIEKWRRQAALQLDAIAPKGNDAAKGTPIGDALTKAETAERREVRETDAASVVGAPAVGNIILWPSDAETKVTKLHGYTARTDGSLGEFRVESSDGWTGFVEPHYDGVERRRVWRVVGAKYDTPTQGDPVAAALSPEAIAANGAPAAEDLPMPIAKRGRGRKGRGVSVETEPASAAQPDGATIGGVPFDVHNANVPSAVLTTEQAMDAAYADAVENGASPAEAAASAADVVEASSEPTRHPAAPRRNGKQRARNAQSNGVTRPAPKPSATKRSRR